MKPIISEFSTDFDLLAIKQPNAEALIVQDDLNPVEITYAELNHLINRCAAYYVDELGLSKGSSIVALLPNSTDMIVAFLASIRTGMTFAPLACTATPSEIRRWMELVKPDLTLATDLLKESSLQVASESGPEPVFIKPDGTFSWLPDDPEIIISGVGGARLYISTSGSTGEPKALVIDSNLLWSSGLAFSSYHGLSDKKLRFWNYLPMSYLGGLFNLALIPLAAGGSVLIDDPFSGRTFLNYWKIVERYKINALWFVPTIVHGILKLASRIPKEKITEIRSWISTAFLGTAPISLHVKEEFESLFGIPLIENYGLSETTFISSENLKNPENREEGTTGKPLPYAGLKFIRQEDTENDPDSSEYLEISVKSPYLFVGYLGSDDEIDRARDKNGYFRTGDVGKLTDHQQLKITGRIRDILKKGGYMVSLKEVEKLAESYEGVAEAAGVKIPHEFYGESYHLYVVPADTEDGDKNNFLDNFETYLYSHLVKYKWPERVIVAESFPKTISGKVQKHLLTEDSKL